MFYIKVISCVWDLIYVFDGLLYYEIDLEIIEYYIDIVGFIEYVFVLMYLFGFVFVLRIWDFYDKWLFIYGKVELY